jgi:uncharacterized iron-regulated membrane protein
MNLLAVIHPLWPATPEAESGGSLGLWLLCSVVLALTIGGVISWLAWQDRRRNAPVERAFRAMARRLRLGRRRAELVRVLAEDRNLPPVSLLISEHAFDAAARASTRNLESRTLEQLRHDLFGER